MKTENLTVIAVKTIASGVVKHLLFWPLWWYSSGFFLVLKVTGRNILSTWKSLALDIWLANIFRPMYGQYDAASRIISFIMRLVQIVFRLIIMIVISVFIIFMPLVYLVLPLIAVWQLLIH